MDEDYFSDNPDAAPEKPMPDEKEQGEQSALLPKSILMGKEFQPGDELVLKIDAIHEDEIAVSLAADAPDKKPTAPPPKQRDAEMASLYD